MVYLPTFSETNARDPRLLMTTISENVPATSEAFWWFSEDFWTLPKMSKDVLTTTTIFRYLSCVMRLRTICVDLWVRCEKLSLIREVNAFSPEAWDSHIMRECGQVQHGLRSQVLTLRHETNTVSLSISQNYWRNWNLNVWKGLYTETA